MWVHFAGGVASSPSMILSLVFLTASFARGVESGISRAGKRPMDEVVACVRANEGKLALIKMEFCADFTSEGDLPDYSYLPRVSSREQPEVHHEETEWAQDGIRQRFVRRIFSEHGLGYGAICVVDGEVRKGGDWPKLKRGTIKDVSQYDRWMANFASLLFYRPFYRPEDGARLLSEILATAEVTSDVVVQKLHDRAVFVVDIKGETSPWTRLYIDAERGLLLRSDSFLGHPDSQQAKLHVRTELTKVHQTENGGWVPIEGRRTFHGDGYKKFIDVRVDVNSISVNRADIPDSLFQLDFPEHTIVFNYILGIEAQIRAQHIADDVLSDLNEITEETGQDNDDAPQGNIDDGNDDAGEVEPSDDSQEESREESSEGADEAGSSGDLVWAWGMRHLGLFLVVAGVSVFVLVLRRGFRAQ